MENNYRKNFIRIYIVSIVLVAFYYIYKHRVDIAIYVVDISPVFLLAALFLGFSYFISFAIIWKKIQTTISPRPKARLSIFEWLRIYMLGFMGRYLPGKVGLIFGRILFLERYGYEKKSIVLSAVYENIFSVLNSLLLGCLVIVFLYPDYFTGSFFEAYSYMAIIVAFAVLYLVSPWFFKTINYFLVLFKRTPVPDALRLDKTHLALIFICYTVPFLVGGLVLLVFLNTLVFVEFSVRNIFLCAAITSLSGVIGTFAVFAPGGIGVREAVQVGLYVSMFALPLDLSVMISIMYRLFITLCEFLFLFILSGVVMINGRKITVP